MDDWLVSRRKPPRSTSSLVAAAAAGAAAVLLLGAAAVGTHAFGLRVTVVHAATPRGLWQDPAVTIPGPPGAPASVGGSAALVGPPTRLRIPSISVDTTVVPLGLDKSGALEAPDSVTVAGWYADGTAPGDIGPAVIAGHVDSKTAAGVFKKLSTLESGDRIQVFRDGRWLDFVVVDTSKYAKSNFPTASVYGPTPDAELRLITCGGQFDPAVGSYEDNVVVYAVVGGS
jgi:sortase family protein